MALDVWEIIRAFQDFGSVDRMLEESDLTETQLRLALAYYDRFPEEIDAAIAESRRSLATLRTQFPTVDVNSVPA